MTRFPVRLLALAYVAALVRLVQLADQGALPAWARRVHEQPFGDDLAHLLLALGLTALLDLGLGRRRAFGVRIGVLLALVALTAEELSQAFLPTRVLSPHDLLATWIGVAIGAWFTAGPWTRGQSNGSSRSPDSDAASTTRTIG
jgi:VanZ family protein